MAIKKGDLVKVEYTGTFTDGTVFDSSKNHGKPLEFKVGSGELIKGFDEAVVGMKVNEEKSVKINPSEAYGDYNQNLVKKILKNQLPKGKVPEVGMMLTLGTPDGKRIPARITHVDDMNVSIDLNHPLAGKTLQFKIKVVDFKSEHKEQL